MSDDTTKDKDTLRRMAYMDEELSVDEVIAYEEKLSREAKASLESDPVGGGDR